MKFLLENCAKPRKSSPMTETELAATIQATPLAALLASAVLPPELTVYRGVLTPRELDAPERETAALATGAAAHDLGWFRRVAVRGEDRFRWLSGMVTNVVNELGANAGAWNLVLNAQGRIRGDLTVWRERDELDLEIEAGQFEPLMAHLERFIVMDDVELVVLSGEAAVGLTGPASDDVLDRLSLPTLPAPMTTTRVEWNGVNLRIFRGYGVLAPHYELWAPEPGIKRVWGALHTAGATAVGAASLEAFRIAEGIPAYGIDIAERDLPQETSQMRALNFNKGCYLGQEIVERIRSRGSVHRHLRQLELTGPVPADGTELTMIDGTAVGQVTSAARLALPAAPRIFALGMIRAEAELRDQPLGYASGAGSGTARIVEGQPHLNG